MRDSLNFYGNDWGTVWNDLVQLGCSSIPSSRMSFSDINRPSAHISCSDTFSLIRLTAFRTKMSCSELLSVRHLVHNFKAENDPQELGDPCPNRMPEIHPRSWSGHPFSIPEPIPQAPCRSHQLLVSLSVQFAF